MHILHNLNFYTLNHEKVSYCQEQIRFHELVNLCIVESSLVPAVWCGVKRADPGANLQEFKS